VLILLISMRRKITVWRGIWEVRQRVGFESY
jgi:hypothetical protein